jgi:hypothetical protein
MTEVPGPHPANSLRAESAWEKKRTEIETLLASPPAKPSTKAQSLTETKGDERRETRIHIRGDYTQTGDAVRPNVPKILPPTLNSSNPSRLDLAHWLFAPENPSTARVSVNRIWQHLFGTGIVATSDDLGTYGDRPTHPELLDWLATEYRAKGWSRKKLIRQILMSDTYRQSSKNMSPDLSNQLLWRQNSYRVPAETVRDIHLVASGLFEPEIGGPGIHPPLPEFVTAVGRSVKWPESTGPDRYRRGMYIFLKRTVLYPMLTTFDAPDTSVACSRREKRTHRCRHSPCSTILSFSNARKPSAVIFIVPMEKISIRQPMTYFFALSDAFPPWPSAIPSARRTETFFVPAKTRSSP